MGITKFAKRKEKTEKAARPQAQGEEASNFQAIAPDFAFQRALFGQLNQPKPRAIVSRHANLSGVWLPLQTCLHTLAVSVDSNAQQQNLCMPIDSFVGSLGLDHKSCCAESEPTVVHIDEKLCLKEQLQHRCSDPGSFPMY